MNDGEYRRAATRALMATRSSRSEYGRTTLPDRVTVGQNGSEVHGDSNQTRDDASDGPSRPFLSVVFPAYNEEGSVGATVTAVASTIDEICDSYELIVVDDGSDDATLDELHDASDSIPSVRVIRNEENRGKGQAIRDGCQGATGEYVLLMDADGEFSPKEVERFLKRAEATGADAVIGSKRHPDSDVSYPLKRHALSKGYSLLIRALFGLQVTDTQVGMKLLRSTAVDDVMPLLLVERYAFDVELLALLHQNGHDIAEAPVSIDFNGNSSINWREVGRIGWDTLTVFCRLKVLRSYEKIRRGVRYAQETRPTLQEE